jgi:hypothetical protein
LDDPAALDPPEESFAPCVEASFAPCVEASFAPCVEASPVDPGDSRGVAGR